MEENSHFGNPLPSEQPMLEQLYSVGSTCDAYRVRLYGKLHFLKRLKQQHVNDIRFVEAFQKEFEVGYGLEHPNLIRYLSFSDDGILMEYVDGETLTDFLLSHPNYFKVQAHSDKFVRQMLSVMQYLHDHREDQEAEEKPGTPGHRRQVEHEAGSRPALPPLIMNPFVER